MAWSTTSSVHTRNTTHVACAVAVDSEAPFGRGDLHLLLHDAPASSGEADFWVLPDISVDAVYVPRDARWEYCCVGREDELSMRSGS